MTDHTHTSENTTKDLRTWRTTLAAMFIAQFLSGVGFSFVLPFFPFFFRSLGVESQEAVLRWNGWSALVFGVTMTVSAPIWGILADRYGRKLMVIRSMLAASIILGLMGFATQPWHLLVLRLFQGATTGTVTASITLVSSISKPSNRGFSLGLMQTAILLGAAAGPLLGGVLAEQYGFKVSCALASVLLLSGFVFVITGTTERFTRPAKKKIRSVRQLKDIITISGFKMLMLIYFLVYVLSYMIVPILPLYIEALSGKQTGAESLTGIFVGVTFLITGLSAIVYGKLGDRYGYKKILLFSLIATGIVTIPQSMAPSTTVLFIERCIFGLSIGGLIPSVNALISRIVPRHAIGSAYGLTSAVTCFGIGMGPFIGGLLASVAGLRLPFVVMGLSAIALAVGVQKMFHPHRMNLSAGEV